MSFTKWIIQDIDAAVIQQCERRLALSASLVGDLLLEALDVTAFATDPARTQDPLPTQVIDDVPTDETSNQSSPDLIEQAAELRQTRDLDGRGHNLDRRLRGKKQFRSGAATFYRGRHFVRHDGSRIHFRWAGPIAA